MRPGSTVRSTYLMSQTRSLSFMLHEEDAENTDPRARSGQATAQGDVAMKKTKPIVAKNAAELAEVLGLDRADGIEFAVRSALNTKIIVNRCRRSRARAANGPRRGPTKRVPRVSGSARSFHSHPITRMSRFHSRRMCAPHLEGAGRRYRRNAARDASSGWGHSRPDSGASKPCIRWKARWSRAHEGERSEPSFQDLLGVRRPE